MLGKGAQASVYLAKRVEDTDDTFYAVKVFEKPGDLVTEVQYMMSLHHENILKIIEHQAAGQLLLPNRTSFEMAYVVQEMALGGEIFDFIATGPLPEKISRMYFK